MIKNNKITLRIYDEKIDTIDCKDNFLIDEDKEFNPLLFNHNFYSYFPEYKQIDKILYIRTEKSLFYKKFVFQQLEYKNILKLNIILNNIHLNSNLKDKKLNLIPYIFVLLHLS